MTVSKAQQKATTKYKKTNYGEIKLLISPKEKKEEIQAHANTMGESMNGFVNRAIIETMERDNAITTPERTESSGSDQVESSKPKTVEPKKRQIDIMDEYLQKRKEKSLS